jgi:hypothetical protein
MKGDHCGTIPISVIDAKNYSLCKFIYPEVESQIHLPPAKTDSKFLVMFKQSCPTAVFEKVFLNLILASGLYLTSNIFLNQDKREYLANL